MKKAEEEEGEAGEEKPAAARTVTAGDLAALKAHLEDGPRGLDPGIGTAASPSPRRVTASLRVMKFRLNGREGAPVIAVDGSAETVPGADGGGFAGCAAVASSGRALVAWFTFPPMMDRSSIFAEWQALRLGLRLAVSLQVPVTVLTDNAVVATEGRRADTSAYSSFAVGAHDARAHGEIRSAAAQGALVRIAYRPALPGDSPNQTAATVLGRAAHALAWGVRRLAADGADPAGEREWLTRIAEKPPMRGAGLRQLYLHRGTVAVTRLASHEGADG